MFPYKIKILSLSAFVTLCSGVSFSDAQTPPRKLCVNGSSQVFARPNCLAAEREFVLPTATPAPTPTSSAGALNLNTCRRIATTAASNVGVATAAFQCDVNNEFVLNYGFTTSDGFRSDASVRRQEVSYLRNGNLPVGVSVTMEGSRARNYNLNLTATCCRR